MVISQMRRVINHSMTVISSDKKGEGKGMRRTIVKGVLTTFI